MNQPHRTLPTGSDWVDVEAGTAARAIFTDEAIWQLVQDRTHRGHGAIRLQVFLIVPLEGGDTLIAGDTDRAQPVRQLPDPPAQRRVTVRTVSRFSRGDHTAVTVNRCRMCHHRPHGERNVLHGASHG